MSASRWCWAIGAGLGVDFQVQVSSGMCLDRMAQRRNACAGRRVAQCSACQESRSAWVQCWRLVLRSASQVRKSAVRLTRWRPRS